jgi:integrase/recombinase XerC/integrase/recombinase XerD
MTTDPRTHLKVYRVAEQSQLGKHVNLFLLDCEARNLTPATVRFYWQRLGQFVAFLERQRVTTPAGITSALIRSYLASFMERQLSPYYQHQHARCVRTWCSFLVREGVLTDSPMRTVKSPKLPKDLLPPFTPADVRAILDACGEDRDRALVLTLLDSGVRASELLALDVGDVDLLTGALRVRLGKGRKDRVTFIGGRTRKAITRYLWTRADAKPNDPLFVTLTTGTRLKFFGLQSLLRRLGAAAGVDNMGAHRFRRTFAIESLRAGMPLPQLAALMGHEGLAVLQRYLRLVEADLQAAHAAHGAVDRLLRT